MLVTLRHRRTTESDDITAGEDPSDGTEIVSACREFLGKRVAIRHSGVADRSSGPIFRHCSCSDEQRSSGSVLPIEAGPQNAAAIGGHIRPAVAIEILLLLMMPAAEERVPPVVTQ